MDLQELRNEINDIDSQMQELFNKRMQISVLPKHHGYFKVPSVSGVFCRLR